MTFTTKRARKKDVFVQYVQVTEENIGELAKWCGGSVRLQGDAKRYIFLNSVLLPIAPRQKQAFVGDFVLKSPAGFKFFTERGFRKSFEDAPE